MNESSRSKRWFFPRNEWRASLRERDRSSQSRELFAEVLESRTLFSAAPVDVLSDEAASQESVQVVHQLSQADVETLAEVARDKWQEAGATEEQLAALDEIEYVVDDLDGNAIGSFAEGVVSIDVNANGTGWFIDETPYVDEEFYQSDNGVLIAAGEGPARDRMDLLSVLMHEQGHSLGMSDRFESGQSSNLMFGFLSTGVRKLPAIEVADFLQPVSEPQFASSNVLLNETFDNDAAFTKSSGFHSDGGSDYVGIVGAGGGAGDFDSDGTSAPTSANLASYSGNTGNFLAGEDMDGNSTPNFVEFSWSGLNVTGLNALEFNGDFASLGGNNDYIRVAYSVDGGTTFTDVMAFEGETGGLQLDSDFDGNGDGAFLSTTLTNFAKIFQLPAGATNLDLRVTTKFNATNEGFAADNFHLSEAPVFTIQQTAVSQPEGDSGNATYTYTVTRNGCNAEAHSLDWSVASVGGVDFDGDGVADGTLPSGTVNFAAGGADTQTITFTAAADTISEDTQNFSVTLANPSDGLIDPAANTVAGTLVDDDYEIRVNDMSVDEVAGVMSFAVFLDKEVPVGETITVDYSTADGTATAGTDYTAVTGTLTFNPGDQVQIVRVPITEDALTEGDETFTLTLSDPSNGLLVDASGTGTIGDTPTNNIKGYLGTISGNVFEDSDNDGVDDGAAEADKAGVVVNLLSAAGIQLYQREFVDNGVTYVDVIPVDTGSRETIPAGFSAITSTRGADGNYSFDDLPAGDYQVQFVPVDADCDINGGGMVDQDTVDVTLGTIDAWSERINFQESDFATQIGSGVTEILTSADGTSATYRIDIVRPTTVTIGGETYNVYEEGTDGTHDLEITVNTYATSGNPWGSTAAQFNATTGKFEMDYSTGGEDSSRPDDTYYAEWTFNFVNGVQNVLTADNLVTSQSSNNGNSEMYEWAMLFANTAAIDHEIIQLYQNTDYSDVSGATNLDANGNFIGAGPDELDATDTPPTVTADRTDTVGDDLPTGVRLSEFLSGIASSDTANAGNDGEVNSVQAGWVSLDDFNSFVMDGAEQSTFNPGNPNDNNVFPGYGIDQQFFSQSTTADGVADFGLDDSDRIESLTIYTGLTDIAFDTNGDGFTKSNTLPVQRIAQFTIGGSVVESAEVNAGCHCPEPQLEVKKYVDVGNGNDDAQTALGAPAAAVGSTVTYTITIDHTTVSAVQAEDVTITDLLSDANITLVAGSVSTTGGTITTGNGLGGNGVVGGGDDDTTVIVDIGSLPLGDDVTITFQAIIDDDSSITGSSNVPNTVSLVWDETDTGDATDGEAAGTDDDPANVLAQGLPTLQIKKYVEDGSVTPNASGLLTVGANDAETNATSELTSQSGKVTYTLLVNHTGESAGDAHDIVIAD
ncbi:MAG: Calx-beta domain-containing protein, partial [Verrucomicrobiota bacterium]